MDKTWGGWMLLANAAAVVGGVAPWMNSSDSASVRAQKLVEHMTTDEKLALFHGSCGSLSFTGHTCGNTRLGIPHILMQDGPQGFKDPNGATSTCWPSMLAVTAGFDPQLMQAWGAAMGNEFYRKGANVQLGPAVNVERWLGNGRNYEYASGEDPYLGYHMAAAVVTGIQSQGVIANVKHFVNNNQENHRMQRSENVDERTQFEIYYPPFEGAIHAGVGSVMCSYNKICQNCPAEKIGNWSCENHDTLQRDLKDRLGFKGWVMSDWGATHSPSINQGLDQEMPGSGHMGGTLAAMVQSGEVSMEKVDDSATRILWPFFAVGLFDNPNPNDANASTNVTSRDHSQLARKMSAESTVLLKNDGILPIASGVKRVAIIGSQAVDPILHGGGSGRVLPPRRHVAPLEAVTSRLGVGYVHYVDGSDKAAAAALATVADIVIVFVGTPGSEGGDRPSLALGGGQDDLIAAVAAVAGNKTAVVAVTPGAVLTPWRGSVAAVLIPFMPGQEYGNAITDVLFGDVNPSGKLPMTFPNKDNEMNFTEQQYPGTKVGNSSDYTLVAVYSERLQVGYRWYASRLVSPAYPFGHGLSYTTFSYSHMQIRGRNITVVIRNTGRVSGGETPQLYLKFPDIAGEPPKQLKGFKKVFLNPGESTFVTFVLDDRSFSIWDAKQHAWRIVPGEFGVMVGSSSGDIALRGTISSTSTSIIV